MVKVNIHTYGYFYVHEYHRPHINLLTWTCVDMRHRGYIHRHSDVLFSEFVYDCECKLLDQPYRNPQSAQNDTQMEYIWASHETGCFRNRTY